MNIQIDSETVDKIITKISQKSCLSLLHFKVV